MGVLLDGHFVGYVSVKFIDIWLIKSQIRG